MLIAARPGPNPEVSMVLRLEGARCASTLKTNTLPPVATHKSDSKPTANRQQSDSNLLTPARPDAILESETVYPRLCAGTSTPAEPPGVNGLQVRSLTTE